MVVRRSDRENGPFQGQVVGEEVTVFGDHMNWKGVMRKVLQPKC
jgi:hypothetical protein